MSNDFLDPRELEPINASPEKPLEADVDSNKGLEDGPGLTGGDLPASPSTEFEDDFIDGELDVGGPPSSGEVARRIERMTRMQIFDYVLHTGAVLFDDGRELISCAACDHDAVCGLRPTVHEITGQPIMVCTGPTMEAKHRFFRSTKFEAGKVKPGCPYHPDKRREVPEGVKNMERRGLSASEVDRKLKEKYSR